jgi:hypothetical protein
LIFNGIAAFIWCYSRSIFGQFTDRKAYYYFFGAFALIFNDVFAAITTYYIDDSFEHL